MSLKVFDLYCELGHVFEGWFGSTDTYEKQQEQGLITCPVCSSRSIGKKLSAPRLNISHLRKPPSVDSVSSPGSTPEPVSAETSVAQLQAAMFTHIRKLVNQTENVGANFAQEARSMHEGDIPERAIRGTATTEERQELAEEGIAVLPIPDFLDDDRLQ